MQILPPEPVLQRARGRVEVRVLARGGANRLDRLFQSGSAKAILPRVPGTVPEIVLLNTAGGLAGGDRFDVAIEAGGGAALVATSQAAERVYRSAHGAAARVAVRLAAGPGARLEWLPQETILFDAGRLERSLEADIASDASLTLLESVTLGRAAMGETVVRGRLVERWRVRRGGRLVHAEALRLDGDLAAAVRGPATLGGARAFATLVHVAPDAGSRLAAARRALPAPRPGLAAAASLKADVLVLRILAAEPARLRAVLADVLAALRDGPPPRVWNLQE